MQLREFTRVIGYPKSISEIKTQNVIIQIKDQNTVIHHFPFTIGSQKNNDLVIQDDHVSRKHCQIMSQDGFYYLEDLKSTNGTYLNSLKIEKEKLATYNSIVIGKIEASILIKNTKQKIESHPRHSFYGIITKSPKMFKIFTLMRQFAPLQEPVVIMGETGCGKELAARAIHEESKLSGPFIALNCGAIARELIESELFGHVKGSFTGAHQTRKGAFQLAHGGTLFLDEIGELPLDQQVKLLRVLETNEITPIGAESKIKVSARVICATHQNLQSLVSQQKLREDLYYRLWVLPLFLPPLRERKMDISLLAKTFALQKGKKLDPLLQRILYKHTWPGNIRELKNTIFHLAALTVNETLGLQEWRENEELSPFGEKLKNLEKKHIENFLLKHAWEKLKTAQALGISRATLYRKIKKYHLEQSTLLYKG